MAAHFVLNLDKINGRNTDRPTKTQEIVKGYAEMHYYDPEATVAPGTIKDTLILAIDATYLAEMFVDLYNSNVPDDERITVESALIKPVSSIYTEFEDDYYDPDHVYAGILVQVRPV